MDPELERRMTCRVLAEAIEAANSLEELVGESVPDTAVEAAESYVYEIRHCLLFVGRAIIPPEVEPGDVAAAEDRFIRTQRALLGDADARRALAVEREAEKVRIKMLCATLAEQLRKAAEK